MKILTLILLGSLAFAPVAFAGKKINSGYSLDDLAAAVSKNESIKIVMSPEFSAQVILKGEPLDEVGYSDFLSILSLNKLSVVKHGDYHMVVPLKYLRSSPIPFYSGTETYPSAQMVSAVLPMKNLCPPHVLPIIRPLVPQYSHLTAHLGSRSILITDSYENVLRIKNILERLDEITEPKKVCDRPKPKMTTRPEKVK